MKVSMKALLLAGLCVPGAGSLASTLYSNNFETGPLGPEWSTNSVLVQANNFTRFNGRYSSGYTELTLGYPSTTTPSNGLMGSPSDDPIMFRVTFDFYAIDTWDGNASHMSVTGVPAGPDWLDVSVNQVSRFHETFNNRGYTQSFHEPETPRSDLGFLAYNDAIYRTIGVDFTVAPNTPIVIRWQDGGLQGLNDESWGIDNVSVTYTNVPAPGALGVMGGLLVMGRRRRR